jgi:predicted SnoaL-like aldol condensation-catalyzing enzyme
MTRPMTASTTPSMSPSLTPSMSPSMSPSTTPEVQMQEAMTAVDTRTLIRRLIEEVYQQRRFDLGYFAADYVDHSPASGPDRDGLIAWLDTLSSTFENLTVSVDHLLVQGDLAMALLSWRGQSRTTGVPLELGTAELFRVEAGLVVEHWDVIDYAPLTLFDLPALDQVEPAGPEADPSNLTAVESANVALVRRVWTELMNQHQTEHLTDYYRSDYIQHNKFAADAGAGLAGMTDFFTAMFTLVPDLTSTITQIVVDGDMVGLFAVWRGHQAGTDSELELNTADLLRIQDGLIAEHWDVFDYAAIARFGVA